MSDEASGAARSKTLTTVHTLGPRLLRACGINPDGVIRFSVHCGAPHSMVVMVERSRADSRLRLADVMLEEYRLEAARAPKMARGLTLALGLDALGVAGFTLRFREGLPEVVVHAYLPDEACADVEAVLSEHGARAVMHWAVPAFARWEAVSLPEMIQAEACQAADAASQPGC